jgi:adenine-specific DNA-methyltransferase
MIEMVQCPNSSYQEEFETLKAWRSLFNKDLAPEEARVMFQKVLEIVAEQIGISLPYSINVNSLNARMSRSLRDDVRYFLAQQIVRNPDLLDEIYMSIIPQQYRRQYGQFFTPHKIAKFMGNWLLSNGARKILDPAVGTGVFLSQIYQTVGDKENLHMTGIDVDPLMLNSTFIRLKLQGMNINNLQLLKEDFLLWSSDELYDAIICNPPYIKFHGFDRDVAKKVSSEFNISLSQLTNIYALFFIRAVKFVKQHGLLAFITPSEFLYTGYGQALKKFILENYRVEALILVGLQKEVFEKAMTTALITFLVKDKPERSHKVKFVNLESDYHEIPERLEELEPVNEIPQYELDPKEKWLGYFVVEEDIKRVIDKLVPLSTIATVDRGIATGCNEFFTLSKEVIKKFSIPESCIKPVIAKASHAMHYDFTYDDWVNLANNNENVYLLYCFKYPPPEELKTYLEYGMKMNVHKRYIPSHRKVWYWVDKREPAPILALVFSRDRMRFIFNKAGVLNLTPFHCVYPSFKDELKLKALLAYLNSNICQKIATLRGRIYGTGLRKLEPKDLEELLVIDVNSLTHNDILKLAELFDKLCEASRTDAENEAEIKKKIDEVVKEILERLGSKGQKFLDEFIR